MNIERKPIRPLKDRKVFKRDNRFSLFVHLFSVVCLLFSDTQSFGSWLEPRYIFGAETLKLDQ